MTNPDLRANRWFPSNLARLMLLRGLNDPRLAEVLSIKRQAVHRWRKGDNVPSQDNFAALCVVLNCRAEALLNEPPVEEDVLPITLWAKREGIPVARARDLFLFRLLTGEQKTTYNTIVVPASLKAPENSKKLVLMAKRRPRWVATFHKNFSRLMEETGTPLTTICAHAGVQYSAALHWVHWRNYPDRKRLPLIAKAMGVSVRQLAGPI